jgi:hypothetical protein
MDCAERDVALVFFAWSILSQACEEIVIIDFSLSQA